MWEEIAERVKPLLLEELDEDLRELTRTYMLPVKLALQVQQARELKRLREELAALSREVWLLKEGRSA